MSSCAIQGAVIAIRNLNGFAASKNVKIWSKSMELFLADVDDASL